MWWSLDLEDAVAPEAKDAARAAVCAAVARLSARAKWWCGSIRCHRPGARDDLEAVAAAEPDAILLPKVQRPADIEAAGQTADIPLWAMIETPARGAQSGRHRRRRRGTAWCWAPMI